MGEFFGPLVGMASGMQATNTDYLLTVPCDSPFIPPVLAEKLFRELQDKQADISVAHDSTRMQPVFALLRTGLLPSLMTYLEDGGRKIDTWYAEHRLARTDFLTGPMPLSISTHRTTSNAWNGKWHIRRMLTSNDHRRQDTNAGQLRGRLDAGTLSAEEAEHRIEALIRPVDGYEKVAVRSALNRTLAEDVYSTVNVPAHTNSAMDGYAVRSSDLPADDSTTTLTVIGTAWAGRPYHGSVQENQCVRIMTGAKNARGDGYSDYAGAG